MARLQRALVAIVARGMKMSFKEVFAVGWRPTGLMIAETAWIVALVFIAA